MGLHRVDYGGAQSGSLTTDALLVSGGWNPAVHLTSHTNDRRQSKPVYDADLRAFLPPELVDSAAAAGSVTGALSTADCLASAVAAAAKCGGAALDTPAVDEAAAVSAPKELWAVPGLAKPPSSTCRTMPRSRMSASPRRKASARSSI